MSLIELDELTLIIPKSVWSQKEAREVLAPHLIYNVAQFQLLGFLAVITSVETDTFSRDVKVTIKLLNPVEYIK